VKTAISVTLVVKY